VRPSTKAFVENLDIPKDIEGWAEKHKIEVTAPKIDASTESKVIAIRHGLSKMNFNYIE
jgi:hypothetical protein